MDKVEITASQIKLLRDQVSKPLVLVGMMGTGKSHIGRKLAEQLRIPFRDSDKVIEQRAGMTIPEIFSTYGEEKFRAAEKNAILEIIESGKCILATGGGAVMNPEVLSAIKEKSVSIWLKSEIDEILKRIGGGEGRPLLQSGDPREVLAKLMTEREPFYSQADIEIQTEEGSPDKTLLNLTNKLYEHLKTARF